MKPGRAVSAWISILVFLSLFTLFTPAPVRADIAPPQPPLGSGIFPGQAATQVRMQAETVLIDLPSSSKYENWQASVTAVFTMRNLGSSAENLAVRFPMFMTEEYRGVDAGCPEQAPDYPAIQNFRALADGAALDVKIIEADMTLVGSNTSVRKPCWAEFPITFPAGKDLQVEVRYLIQGQLYGHGESNYLGFPYILTTGAGWQGTIGSADVRLRLPYPASEMNVSEISEGGQIVGSEVRWHFEDFEPDRNTSVWIVNPRIWQALQKDLGQVKTNPQDGEAWGRIGMNEKNIFFLDRGYREGAVGADLFRTSQEAYQKSVSLLPKDADWHFGYGDLLCETAWWRDFTPDMQLPSTLDLLTGCMTQLQLALQINPAHAKTIDLLQTMSSFQPGIVDLNGAKPDFLVLTPGNYHTPTPWATATEAPAPTLPPTATVDPTDTVAPSPAPSDTPAPSATPPPSQPTAAPATPTASKPSGAPLCGAILLPLLLALLIRRH